jgi:hypothetical protein
MAARLVVTECHHCQATEASAAEDRTPRCCNLSGLVRSGLVGGQLFTLANGGQLRWDGSGGRRSRSKWLPMVGLVKSDRAWPADCFAST